MFSIITKILVFILVIGIFHDFWLAASALLLILLIENLNQKSSYEQVVKLVWLRLDIDRQLKQGRLSEESYHALLNKINQTITKVGTSTSKQVSPAYLKARLIEAWALLEDISSPPVNRTLPNFPQVSPSLVKQPVQTTSSEKPVTKPGLQVSSSPFQETLPPLAKAPVGTTTGHQTTLPSSSQKILPSQAKASVGTTVKHPAPTPPTVRHPISQKASLSTSIATTKPIEISTKKSLLSPILKKLRLPNREFFANILLPFLWQNIGWFIGSLCFVSGSIFLVAYTSGFAKSLAVFLVVMLYTGILFVGGYQLRRRRPELVTSSNALFILAVLLVPLNLGAGTRLLESSGTNLGLLSISLLLSLFAVGSLMVATKLATGAMERSLVKEYSWTFISLASLQLITPLFKLVPYWPWLALTHLGLLGLLSYALGCFGQHWLRAIFVDRKMLTFYSIGSLLYAALISFLHLTLGSGLALPKGYFAPFLMSICILLFYIDIQFKQWVHQRTWLGYFTFVVYALSIMALGLSLTSPSVPIRSLTWLLGAGLYSMMVWHYLTWPPLYLSLACLSGLYALHLLQYFPHEWHFLLSLPGLAGIFAIQKLALARQSAPLALITSHVMNALGWGLLLWSLSFTTPQWLTFITALIATSWVALHSGGYLLTSLATLTLAYTPPLLSLLWWEQFSYGLIGLASLWTVLAQTTSQPLRRAFLNSALLSFAASLTCLGLTFPTLPPVIPSPFAAAVMTIGLLVLWLSLSLYSRELFYGALVILGISSQLFHNPYIPHAGIGIIITNLAIWMLAWWLSRLPKPLLAAEIPTTSFSLLGGLLPVNARFYQNRVALVRLPLQQAFYLLWLAGLIKVGSQWWGNHITTATLFATGLSALVTILVAGESRRLWLLPLAIGMLVGIIWHLTPTTLVAFNLAMTALLIWLTTIWVTAPPHRWSQWLGWQSGYQRGRETTEKMVHQTTFIVSLISLGHLHNNILFPTTLIIVALFLGLAGLRYHLRLHSYLVLGIVSGLYFHGLTLLFSDHFISDYILLLLTLLATGLVLLDYFFNTLPLWRTLYQRALYHLVSAIHLFVLSIILNLFIMENKFHLIKLPFNPIWLPVIFLLLAIGQVLVTRFWNYAPLRSITVPLFAAAIASTLQLLWPLQLTLILISTGFFMWALGHYLLPRWHQRWPQWEMTPHVWISLGFLSYGWALLETWQPLAMTWQTGTLQAGWLPAALTFLAVAQFPMLRPWPWAPLLRGLMIPLLLAATVASTLLLLWPLQLTFILISTGFFIWALGHYLLPLWNQRWPQWEMTPHVWISLGFLSYGWALLETWHPLAMTWQTGTLQAGWLPGVFIFLAFAQLPMLHSWPWAPVIRGVSIPLLLTMAVTTGVIHLVPLTLLFTTWSFMLWGIAHYGLPPFNKRWPQWTIQPQSWPLWGLGFLFLTLFQEAAIPIGQPTTTRAFLLMTIYLFLMLRIHFLIAWLVVISLFLTGLSAILNFFPPTSEASIVGIMVWINLLLRGIPLCRPPSLRPLVIPLQILPLLALVITFLIEMQKIGGNLLAAISHRALITTTDWLTLGLFALSFLHGLTVWPILAHLFMLTSLILAVLLGTKLGFTWSLTLSLWTLGVLVYKFLANPSQVTLGKVTEFWFLVSFLLALASLAYLPPSTPLQLLFGLALLSGISLANGLFQETDIAKNWLTIGLIIFLIFSHLIWILEFPNHPVLQFLPWYACQNIILAGILWWWWKDLQFNQSVTWLIEKSLLILLNISILAWIIHLGFFFSSRTPPYLFGTLDQGVVIITGLLLMGIWSRQAEGDSLVYGLAVLITLLGNYVRVLWVGFAPITIWDTTALIITSYGLSAWQHLFNSQALYRLVLLVPIVALFTVPLQLNSLSATGTLLAASTVYLSMRRQSELPVYLGLLALNVGIYLWLPDLAKYYQMLWIYTVPASTTVLLMLQLHAAELKPSIAHAIRLTALGTLYATAMVDAFLRPETTIFLVAILLGLLGIILGIGLRMRAFLYTGTLFLILNILGQLMRFYPEGRLEKAIILIALGIIIMVSMIWFNLQRETILSRIRIMRADIATWG